MKAHEFITRLDTARYGRSVTEDTKPVAEKPSHAPTSTAMWKTKSSGKEEEGETAEKGYKQPNASMPAPIAKAPSHAPTSGKDATTTGQGKSDDEGEKISKEAIKETVRQLIDGDGEVDFDGLMGEAGHKAGCQCGFCKNKGTTIPSAVLATPVPRYHWWGLPTKDGKSGDDDEGSSEKKDDGGGDAPSITHENYGAHVPQRPMRGAPIKQRLGGAGRMGFRSRVNPPAKAAINPHQPAMEHRTRTFQQAIQEMADQLLEAPGGE